MLFHQLNHFADFFPDVVVSSLCIVYLIADILLLVHEEGNRGQKLFAVGHKNFADTFVAGYELLDSLESRQQQFRVKLSVRFAVVGLISEPLT